jgi:type IV pilus assembly protein PilE
MQEFVVVKKNGFTLIELMMALAIVGILVAIALPSYQQSVRKSHRTDAHVSLASLATQQEKFYFRSNNYTDDFSDIIEDLDPDTATVDSDEGYYAITLTGGAGLRSWSMTAVAQGDQAGDEACAELTLTSTGAKTSEDAAGNPSSECW